MPAYNNQVQSMKHVTVLSSFNRPFPGHTYFSAQLSPCHPSLHLHAGFFVVGLNIHCHVHGNLDLEGTEFPTVLTTVARHTLKGAISALSCTTDRKAIVLATFAIKVVPFVTGVAHTRTVTVTRAVCRTIIWAKFKTTIRLSEPSITVTLACVPTRATARAVFRTG